MPIPSPKDYDNIIVKMSRTEATLIYYIIRDVDRMPESRQLARLVNKLHDTLFVEHEV